MVDSVCYDDQSPWPTKPDGQGPSLELKSAYLDNNVAVSWKASEQTGGTPGKGFATSVKGPDPIPIKYGLFPAWPNPFNSRASIQYSLPEKSKVTVKIFNVMGQKVALLVDEIQEPGYHTFTWAPENLSGGIYFVFLSTGKFTQVRKIISLK